MNETQGQEKINQGLPATSPEFETMMKDTLGKSYDIIIDRFKTTKDEAVLIYVDGLTNKDLIDRDIIRPLKAENYNGNIEGALHSSFNKFNDIPSIINKVLEGNIAVFYDNCKDVYIIELKQWDKRSVETPDAEGSTRGPKEGFTENIVTNTALLRRKLRTPNLTIEKLTLGRQSNTTIAIVYLDDIVNQLVLAEVKKRLQKIDVDAILETGQIEQYIEKKSFSVISGIGMTQKPDIAASRILEGRVAIMSDGTPHVLTIPELFMETLHNCEDYYARTIYSNFLRILRIFALFIAVLLPGISIAIMTYNHEMVPLVFLMSFIKATQNTPLPEAAEVFFLSLMFELLKEAGLRMPKSIGSAITIVGALILGETAVSAGIVGAPSVIIVALTAVSTLLIPNLNAFATIYKFIFLLLGATLGLVGIGIGIMVLFTQLISKDSFGIPILSSFSKEERKDGIIRAPLTQLTYRPVSIVKNNRKRGNFPSHGELND